MGAAALLSKPSSAEDLARRWRQASRGVIDLSRFADRHDLYLTTNARERRGHRMAKAGIENALWDAEAKQKNLPLWKLLGGTRTEIPCGVSIGIQDSVEQLLDRIQTELAAGYRRIKVKVKPGWDVNVLEKIRSRWVSCWSMRSDIWLELSVIGELSCPLKPGVPTSFGAGKRVFA